VVLILKKATWEVLPRDENGFSNVLLFLVRKADVDAELLAFLQRNQEYVLLFLLSLFLTASFNKLLEIVKRKQADFLVLDAN
jgi:hypothetical protein